MIAKNSLLFLFLILLLNQTVTSIYSDQAGVKDWQIKTVGVPKQMFNYQNDKIILSEKNIIGRVNNTNGDLIWRRTDFQYGTVKNVLIENDILCIQNEENNREYIVLVNLDSGDILFNYKIPFNNNVNDITIHIDDEVMLLLINNRFLFNVKIGFHKLNWKFNIEDNESKLLDMIKHNDIIYLVSQSNEQIDYLKLNKDDGKVISNEIIIKQQGSENIKYKLSSINNSIYFIWNNKEEINVQLLNQNQLLNTINIDNDVIANNIFVENDQIYVLFNENTIIYHLNINSETKLNLINKFELNNNNKDSQVIYFNNSVSLVSFDKESIYLSKAKDVVKIAIDEISKYEEFGRLISLYAYNSNNDVELVLVREDGSINSVIYKNDKLYTQWNRNEGLSYIKSSKILSLPEKHLFTIEDGNELSHNKIMNSDNNNVIINFINRWYVTVMNIITYFSNNNNNNNDKKDVIVMDKLGINKLIITVNEFNKMYAIESKNGQIKWTKFIRNQSIVKLYILRESSIKLPPIIGIVAEHIKDGNRILTLYRINGFTGSIINNEVIFNEKDNVEFELNLLPAMEPTHLCNYLSIVNINSNNIRLIPNNNDNDISDIYYSYYHNKNSVSGYSIDYSNNKKIEKNYKLEFKDQVIVQVLHNELSINKMSSMGRILSDRRVMYKYLNNNLLIIITKNINKDNNSFIYLIDSITGKQLYQVEHKNVYNNQIQLLLFENQFVYHYFNIENKNFNFNVIELFTSHLPDVKHVNNDTISSFDINSPYVASNSYVFPHNITSLSITNTLNGITDKELIASIEPNNHIVSISLDELNALRVIKKEENQFNTMLYQPIIRMNEKKVISYGLDISGIKKTLSVASNFESTTLLFSYGLDLFFSAYSPNMQFDLLKEDFSKVSLLATILLLSVAIFFTSPMVRNKKLNDVWY
ncbi:DUF1620-domain-containing protein [Neoconidiobolus thromboides FSU 785]|nr:DUF1620-domain-containing protein [Neoconidiobolus thromboides FSU 785]